jgi:hypothetical protein
MQRFKMRPHIANVDVDPGTPSIAEHFAEIMGHIRVEYDLEPDVWGAAQDVFQALKAKGVKGVETSQDATTPLTVSPASRPPGLLN